MNKYFIESQNEKDFTIKFANALTTCTTIGSIFAYLTTNKIMFTIEYYTPHLMYIVSKTAKNSKHRQTFIHISCVMKNNTFYRYVLSIDFINQNKKNTYETIIDKSFNFIS